VGLATERSIAHGIAVSMRREGAELAFTYQNDRLKNAVDTRGAGLHADSLDVGSDAEIEAAFARVGARGSLTLALASLAPRERSRAGISTR
jgi:enoyl-[acyl-carrier protein] reductase I